MLAAKADVVPAMGLMRDDARLGQVLANPWREDRDVGAGTGTATDRKAAKDAVVTVTLKKSLVKVEVTTSRRCVAVEIAPLRLGREIFVTDVDHLPV